MKHLRQTFFLAVLLSIAGVQAAFSAEPCGNGVYYDWGNDYTTLFILKDGSGDGQMTSHPWTEDAQHYATLTTVVIQDGVTSILGKAFDQCPNLTTVTIAKTVTSIDAEAFSLCGNLETVTFADADQSQLMTIQSNAFANCVKLSSITLPEGVQTIGAYAFVCCYDLASATIPSTVTTMSNDVFRDCTSLATVYCNASTPPTGNYAMFDNNASGRIIYVPIGSVGAYKAAAYWSNYANDFAENTSVGAVFVADGIKYKITKTAPKEVEVVANNYSGAITIPAQTNGFAVTGIGDHAFEMCTGLTSVTLPEGLTTIGVNAFCNCGNLPSVVIPSSVTDIGNYAFANCANLELVKVWASVPPTLGTGAFDNNKSSGRTIKVLKDCILGYQIQWSSYSGSIEGFEDFTINNIWYRYRNASELKVIRKPNNEKYTGTIDIPASVENCLVTVIADEAFDQCPDLTAVTLPNSLKIIGNNAFNGCTGLTAIDIPGGVTDIETNAFYDCTSLAFVKVNAPTPPTLYGNETFKNAPAGLKFYVPNGSLTAYQEASYWSAYASAIYPMSVPYRDAYWDATDKVVKYNDANASDYRVLDANTVNLENGYTYVVSGSVTNNNRLVVNGTASIILCDGASLDAQKGITVGEGKTLNIYAHSEGTDMGEMNAVGDFNYAGIGGGTNGGNGGNVTIYGGNVTARGGDYVAGIGGGYYGAGGNVTIYGGDVTARGGSYGAGIGGGANGAGGTVTIYGGNVTAQGGYGGSGIGSGTNVAGGTVTINGGDVTARGGYGGSGIGGGAYGAGGTVNINGGKVEATCDDTFCERGFAIGMGLYGEDNGTLTVAGGLTVYGASGPSYGYTIIASPYSNRGTLMIVVKSDTPLWEDLPLNENAENSTAIAAAHGKRKNVTLTRTLKAGGWNTFCAPFNISSEQIAAVFGAGAQVKELDDSEFAEDTGILTLKFKDATTIYHGKPYLVKVGANVVNPVFIGVTVDGEWCEISTDYLYFIPVMMSPQWLSGGDKNVIIIKNGNTFTYPKTDGEILCFRGYFLLRQSGPKVNSFIFDLGDGETTSIQLVTTERPLEEDGDFYDLQGRKVEKPAKGLYIKNGKKVIVK